MKLDVLLENVSVKELHADTDMEISGVCCDSRSAFPGCLFVAVRGYETDGHKYIKSAVEKGASCVICEEKPELDVPYIITDNSRTALAVASTHWYGDPAKRLKIIGVTGTNGKTTTTHLIKQLIEKCLGAKVGLIGTNHNMIGDEIFEAARTTPESWEIQELFAKMADAGCEYAVMEVSSHALYLDRVYGVQFAVGAFSNLTRDHLDFHKTMEEYAKAKAILFAQSDKAIINLDDEYADVMISSAKCPVFTYAVNKNEADFVAKDVRLGSEGVEFCALMIGKIGRTKLGIPGMFSVYNASCAMSVALELGIPFEKVCAVLSECRGVMGRAEVVPTGRDFTVLIDYAHTPDALENIINTVRGFAKGRVVTLFGCGGDRDKTKRPIMGKIASELSDFVVVTSDNPRTETPGDIINDILAGMKDTKTPHKVIENRREAIGWAINNAKTDDVIILAGKGHETYQIIGREKNHFDEREVVSDFLNA